MRSMRRTGRVVAAGAVLAALAVPLAALASRAGSSKTTPSFTKDVAPLISEKCTGCHRVGGIGPIPLVTAYQISA